MGVVIEISVKHPGGSLERGGLIWCYISDIEQVWAPQLFYTYFYNHAYRLRLEKLL
jgi:hypothetical protein